MGGCWVLRKEIRELEQVRKEGRGKKNNTGEKGRKDLAIVDRDSHIIPVGITEKRIAPQSLEDRSYGGKKEISKKTTKGGGGGGGKRDKRGRTKQKRSISSSVQSGLKTKPVIDPGCRARAGQEKQRGAAKDSGNGRVRAATQCVRFRKINMQHVDCQKDLKQETPAWQDRKRGRRGHISKRLQIKKVQRN